MDQPRLTWRHTVNATVKRKKNEYFKTIFKDEEMYHLSWIEIKQASVWIPILTCDTGHNVGRLVINC